MYDNIPNRAWDACNEKVILWMQDYVNESEYCVISKPSSWLHDPEEHKNGSHVTMVYCVDPWDPDCFLRCLECVFTDSEEEAERKHAQLLDKWNYIQYIPQSEATDETVQDWRLSDLFLL